MKIGKVLFSGSEPNSALADFGLTLLRVGAGLGLSLGHGWGKLPVSEDFVVSVSRLGFPAPEVFAWAAALSEFGGGLLVALGLATRFGALFALGTMCTAFFLVHAEDPFKVKELAYMYGLVMLGFVFMGGGRFSIDKALRR